MFFNRGNYSRPKRSRAKWCMSVIPALRKLRQEDLKFKARVGYIVRF
jgi:hypothetical protein